MLMFDGKVLNAYFYTFGKKLAISFKHIPSVMKVLTFSLFRPMLRENDFAKADFSSGY